MPTILDPKFVYRNSAATDKPGYLKRRFDAIRKEQAAQAKLDKAAELERILKVRPMIGRKA